MLVACSGCHGPAGAKLTPRPGCGTVCSAVTVISLEGWSRASALQPMGPSVWSQGSPSCSHIRTQVCSLYSCDQHQLRCESLRVQPHRKAQGVGGPGEDGRSADQNNSSAAWKAARPPRPLVISIFLPGLAHKLLCKLGNLPQPKLQSIVIKEEAI